MTDQEKKYQEYQFANSTPLPDQAAAATGQQQNLKSGDAACGILGRSGGGELSAGVGT